MRPVLVIAVFQSRHWILPVPGKHMFYRVSMSITGWWFAIGLVFFIKYLLTTRSVTNKTVARINVQRIMDALCL
ncbi:hypothetical protein [Vibrio sp. MACH09]|uniref:hypothetical protein n=1 Tax=Vibrio sp. MACH09 TaxID=3025122 RepID=UPI00295E393E|nr:hypothetical protein [Vibrio sp. MACH09]